MHWLHKCTNNSGGMQSPRYRREIEAIPVNVDCSQNIQHLQQSNSVEVRQSAEFNYVLLGQRPEAFDSSDTMSYPLPACTV